MHKISDADFFKRQMENPVGTDGSAEPVPGRAVTAVLNDSEKTLKKAGYPSLAAELEQIRQAASHERFTIAVVGEFSRGKSTFINALLKKEFLPVGDLPTTAVMTRIRYHDREVIVAFDENNKKIAERALAQESWKGLVAQNFGGAEFCGNVLAGVASDWLRDYNVELIDTPGAGDLSEKRTKIVGDALLGCDGAIIAVSATAALSLSEKLFIEERLIARKLPFMLVIITKLDQVSADERGQVVAYIKNRLKKWEMDIPVYIPYEVEIPENEYQDIMGMDKIKDALVKWVSSTERKNLVEAWLIGKTLDIMENAVSALNEKLLLLEEGDGRKREELVAQKHVQLSEAKLVWGELRMRMQRKCTECYQLLLSKIDDYETAITERLQYELSHAGDLQKWWQNDFPYRIKVELTNMAVGIENQASVRIEDDVRWYCAAIEKSFHSHLLYRREKISDKDFFGEFQVGKEIEFENLGKQRTAIKIGAAVLSISGFALLSACGFMPIIATMGIGTGTAIFSEHFFKNKIEAQREELKREIARCVPAFIEESMSESEKRLEAVYKNIIDEADRSEKAWLAAQQEAINGIKITENAERIEQLRRDRKLLEEQKSRVKEML